MNNNQKRLLLFLLGCITTRLLLVYLNYNLEEKYLNYFGYLLLVPAIGFAIIYIFGLRKYGRETFGQLIWWNKLRPIHSILYLISGILLIKKNRKAGIILLIDVIIGFTSWLIYRSRT